MADSQACQARPLDRNERNALAQLVAYVRKNTPQGSDLHILDLDEYIKVAIHNGSIKANDGFAVGPGSMKVILLQALINIGTEEVRKICDLDAALRQAQAQAENEEKKRGHCDHGDGAP